MPSVSPSSAQRGPHLCCGAGRIQAGKVPAQHLGYSWHLINASLSSFILLDPSCEPGWQRGKAGARQKRCGVTRAPWNMVPIPFCCVTPSKKLNISESGPGLAGTRSGFGSRLHPLLSFVPPPDSSPTHDPALPSGPLVKKSCLGRGGPSLNEQPARASPLLLAKAGLPQPQPDPARPHPFCRGCSHPGVMLQA